MSTLVEFSIDVGRSQISRKRTFVNIANRLEKEKRTINFTRGVEMSVFEKPHSDKVHLIFRYV